jgi:signal transduction histidine kinase/CheY-like chemotaxis protein
MSAALNTQLKRIHFDDISMRGKARLLEMSHSRQIFGVSAQPFVGAGFVSWLILLGQDAKGLLLWILCYCFASVGMRLKRKQYFRDKARLTDAAMVNKWLPVVHGVALAHGMGLVSAIVLILGHATFEMTSAFYMVLIAIVAANATHLTPVLSAYQRFFVVSWGGAMILMPWSFPTQWPFILPLSAIYSVVIYRHALIAHQFFLQQIRLEEDSAHLAKQYRLAKEEAEAALHAKNQFLSTASHDLRQPVHAMGFLIESIARRNRDETLSPALSDLRQSVRSVTQMFNSLLDLSKIEAGAIEVRLETISLDDLMSDVATVFREEAINANIALRLRLTAGKAFVTADAMLLRQALVNLMHNALRYTQHGGVLMAARRRDNDWQVEVWDTGVGVAMAEQQQIYSAFFRNEHAWQIDNAGHGLGLAVVARCADLMRVTHGLNSRLGSGSRFWLRLPAAQPLSTASPSFNYRQLDRKPFDSQRLTGQCLILDDDPQVCSAWESLLISWGIQVRCAASANEALDAIGPEFNPQAIFCDQRLRAGESGFDVLQMLLEHCPEASGAMISGEFDSPELLRAEQEGYLVLRKPLQPDELHAVLSRWLGQCIA